MTFVKKKIEKKIGIWCGSKEARSIGGVRACPRGIDLPTRVFLSYSTYYG